ncbi:CoA transferase [Mycolicibacterium cosmeticum]|uniref:L-carnitine dehydratase n=1 Tax=Mycolicibacterium cosmeticum TaxID=258533 RepID=W9B024_MYCCO|nr:CoA transferase [Mycolicibacterium cosmeticum]TLH74163.1 CoA transferase [Mycolicibacterium cosmeticum]CDO11118.1 putative L-carnitine dehydratase [Mycolicibacterium cosmeticum]
MITQPFQKSSYDSVVAALPFTVDPSKITVQPGVSYSPSPIKIHDYAVGVMAAFGSVVEHIGTVRGLPAQTMTLNRRHCGLALNSGQLHFLNGYATLLDTWPIGPDNGTYRTADDRYVHMIGLHPHLRDALLAYLNCANTAAAIQAATAGKTAQQLEDEAAAAGLALGIVRSPEEWLALPQGAATAARPMIDFGHTKTAGGRRLGPALRRPLEGVRVIELTHLVAGPTIGRLLAEQGADVIKVQPPIGDWVLPLWLDVSWGKRNIALDIKGRRGFARFAELLSEADVLVSSQRPEALAKLGLDEVGLQRINPNLVVAEASCYASGTPWHGRRGFEQIAQAVTGVMHTHSQDLPEPTVVSVLMNDYLTGYLGAIGAVAALAAREVDGGYWKVGAALTRCSMHALTVVEPQHAEQYAAVSMADLVEFGVDQIGSSGVFTRLAPTVAFSHVPSYAATATNWPATTADTAGWLPPTSSDDPSNITHIPSKMAREDMIRGLIPCYGIEDRGDGGGGLSLASPQLMKLVQEARSQP